MIRLEPVVDALPLDFAMLRAEARADGHGMLDTLAADWASGKTRFDQPGEMLLAVYVGDALAGIGGLSLEPALPGALRARRFYVRIAHRRHGVGRALALSLLQRRAGRTVTCNAAAGSEAFWETLGFTPDRRVGRTHLLAR
jgi:GNAT superfamily N-acetyltransferase